MREEISVYLCCIRFVEGLANKKKAREHATRLSRILEVGAVQLGDIPLPELTHQHVIAWRTALAARGAMVSRCKNGPVKVRRRSEATINRDIVPLRAALNFGLLNGYVRSNSAWKVALRPAKNVGKRRNLYLDRSQRAALLEHLPMELAAFARGLCLLPFRPGALASLKVEDFDSRTQELRIPSDKSGEGRSLLLPTETSAFIDAQVGGRPPDAPLFVTSGGKRWTKDAWKKPIKAAAAVAGLSDQVTAYTLRHSTITDLVTDRLDLFSVAQASGTSVAMIEKHYGQLRKHHVAAALAKLV